MTTAPRLLRCKALFTVALALLALATAVPALADAPTFAWPTRDILEVIDIPGETWAFGVPVRMRQVRVKERLEDVAARFAEAFRAAGFHVPPPEKQVQVMWDVTLTALDPQRRISYTASFKRRKDGTTDILLAEANLGRARPDEAGGVPLPPGAKDTLVTRDEGSQTVSYRVRMRPEELSGFYEKTLAGQGFSPEKADALGHLAFVRGEEELRVVATPEPEGMLRVLAARRVRAELQDERPARVP